MPNRRYITELVSGIAAYTLVLVVSLHFLVRGMPPGAGATCVAIMPMLPALGICWAIVRQLRRIDEFQRRLQLESLAMAFSGTALITFTYGFLENVGYPKISMFSVWPLMGILWVVCGFVTHRRYA